MSASCSPCKHGENHVEREYRRDWKDYFFYVVLLLLIFKLLSATRTAETCLLDKALSEIGEFSCKVTHNEQKQAKTLPPTQHAAFLLITSSHSPTFIMHIQLSVCDQFYFQIKDVSLCQGCAL